MNNSPAEKRERIARLLHDFLDHKIDVDYSAEGYSYSKHDVDELADAILSSDLVGMDQKRACIEGSLTPESIPLSQASKVI